MRTADIGGQRSCLDNWEDVHSRPFVPRVALWHCMAKDGRHAARNRLQLTGRFRVRWYPWVGPSCAAPQSAHTLHASHATGTLTTLQLMLMLPEASEPQWTQEGTTTNSGDLKIVFCAHHAIATREDSQNADWRAFSRWLILQIFCTEPGCGLQESSFCLPWRSSI